VILLDTHVVIWLAFQPGSISRRAKAAIDNARGGGEGLAISDITLLEISALVRKGRVHLDVSLQSFLQELEARFIVLPITSRACALSLSLPAAFPKDPADRMIGATALAEGLPLVTADRDIARSETLRTIW